MTRKTPALPALLAFVAALALVAGCGNSPKRGSLDGHLYAVGGLALAPRPLPGTVVAKGPGGTDRVKVDADGRFHLSLAPGTYTLTGTSPLYESGKVPCNALAKVRVSAGGNATADVLCQER
jgi:hypothetical protein